VALRAAWRSRPRRFAAVLVFDAVWHAAMAQKPFGGPRPPAEPPAGGIIGWILAKQSEFYREMSGTIRAAKSDGSAVWTLLGISFAYGIFHAAGPGHGKAVISSYLVANEETARRGIVLSFASALLQALVAVVIVAVFAWLLSATAKTMCSAEKAIEIVSYALISAFGARLVWTKGGGFMRALQAKPARRLRTSMITTVTIMVMRSSTMVTITTTTTPMITRIRMTMAIRTITDTSTTSIAAIRTARRRTSSPVPAAGSAASAPSSPSACGHARAPSWCWCSRWRRACSGPASPPPS
jgi:ABC-type nickel/cobalt efflux system permease component RcnA